jgi:hypothetical protein
LRVVLVVAAAGAVVVTAGWVGVGAAGAGAVEGLGVVARLPGVDGAASGVGAGVGVGVGAAVVGGATTARAETVACMSGWRLQMYE